MRSFSKYDIIGFLSSTILYFCFVFFILKFANPTPLLPKSNSLNFENAMTIDLDNFLDDKKQENLSNDISKNLQNFAENLVEVLQNPDENLVENENLQNFTDDLAENEVLQEIVPKPEPIVQPKQAPTKPKKEKKAKKSANLENSQNANLSENLDKTGNANKSSIKSNSNSNSSVNSDISAILKAIISKYAKQNYPSEARKLRQTGSVEIGFYYTKEHRIENLQILQSSGFLNLDNAALNAVKKTKSKFPKPDKSDYFTLSINFTLN